MKLSSQSFIQFEQVGTFYALLIKWILHEGKDLEARRAFACADGKTEGLQSLEFENIIRLKPEK